MTLLQRLSRVSDAQAQHAFAESRALEHNVEARETRQNDQSGLMLAVKEGIDLVSRPQYTYQRATLFGENRPNQTLVIRESQPCSSDDCENCTTGFRDPGNEAQAKPMPFVWVFVLQPT
jgi:hypothetical protein